MKRSSRLIVPLLLGIGLVGVYRFFENSPGLIDDAGLRDQALDFLKFAAAASLIFFFVRLIDWLIFDIIMPRRQNVRPPLLLREIVSIVLFVMLFGVALSKIFGRGVTAILAGGTVIAAVLGLALQETLGNLFAGIALHMNDDFEIGDVIRIGDVHGVVESVRWRGTRVRTFNNTILVVPNSLLARERLEVFPRRNLNARVLQIGVDYNIPPSSVIPVLVQAATNVDGVSHDMPCIARVGGFGDSSVTYEIKYFTQDYSLRDRIDSDIRKNVWYALRRNSIPIPLPIRVHHRYEPPAVGAAPDTQDILDDLARIDIFAPLPADARHAIAAAAQIRTYSRGETIISQGAEDRSMFIIHAGAVSVRTGDDELARLGAGEFFGEMALLTGETRTADIVAVEDVVAIEITKTAFEPVLRQYPELAGAITARVLQRRTRNAPPAHAEAEEEQSVVSRIRSYFGL
jgi:small-conductance mechanosensitive channel